MKLPFTKPATTYAEQVRILQSRGMIIADQAQALFYLEHLNYYRLGAYWLPFEADHATHTFQPNTQFDAVVELYIFDRELRLLILDAIERVEVSIRSKWAYELSHRHGPHAHLDSSIFSDHECWQGDLQSLQREVFRSKEVFITHLRQTYQEPLPPVWAVCEVMSLGLLSKWFDNLKPLATRSAIARAYQVDESVLASWLRHLTLVRNICAHHARLWNREFVITPKVIQKKPKALLGQFVSNSRKIYNTIVLLLYLMDTVAPGHHWRNRIKQHLNSSNQNLAAMGFPSNWQNQDIWT